MRRYNFRVSLILVATSILAGCSATMVTTTDPGNKYAPVNEASGGTIKDLAQGADSVIKSRRNNAYKQMHDHCRGPYRIAAEKVKSGDGAAVPVGGTVVYGSNDYIYIDFVCEKAQ